MCYKAEIFVCVIGGVILYVIRRSRFLCHKAESSFYMCYKAESLCML